MSKNIRGINKMIDAVHPGYFLIQENGYVRIEGPDTHEWYCSSVPVCKVSHLTPEQWVDEVKQAGANRSTQYPPGGWRV